jgi:MFS family permease
MATRAESGVVYAAGLVQGLALVTFPAASTIFTDPDEYDLSSSAYGAMFIPQAVTAIGASLLGATWARRVGTRRVYLLGLAADVLAMALLIVSRRPTRCCSWPRRAWASASASPCRRSTPSPRPSTRTGSTARSWC